MRVFTTLDELRVAAGHHLGCSDWILVDADRIRSFDRATGGGSREFLALSLVGTLIDQVMVVEGAAYSVNYGCNAVRFPTPLQAGARVRACADVLAVSDVPGGVQVVTRWRMEIDGSAEPACVAETLSRYYARP